MAKSRGLFYSGYDDRVYEYTYRLGAPGDAAVSGNVNITDDGDCFGQIKTDPDVAGWGVFLSLALNTALIFGLFLTLYWGRYARRLWRKQHVQHLHSGADLTPVESLVWTLADTCLASALAIAISSFAKVRDDEQYPLYHIFIARSYAEIAILGHSVGRMFVYGKLSRVKPWMVLLRTALAAIFLATYIAWGWLAAERFAQWKLWRWPNFTPQCFSYRLNQVPGSFVFWIQLNLWWVPVSFADLFMPVITQLVELVSPVDVGLAATIGVSLEEWDRFLVAAVRHVVTEAWVVRTRHVPSTPRWKVGLAVAERLVLALLKTVLVPPLVLGWGVIFPSALLAPLFVPLFFAWQVFDVVSIKLSNEKVMADVLAAPMTGEKPTSNSENAWGFGQIFPMVMATTFLLALLDAILDYYWLKKQKARKPSGVAPS